MLKIRKVCIYVVMLCEKFYLDTPQPVVDNSFGGLFKSSTNAEIKAYFYRTVRAIEYIMKHSFYK